MASSKPPASPSPGGPEAGFGGRMPSRGTFRRWRTWLEDLPWLLPAVAFVLLFSLLPLLDVFSQAWTFGHGVRGVIFLLRSNNVLGRATREALGNSLEQGVLSAGLASLWGVPVGVFLARNRFPGRDLLLAFLLVPFLLPVLVVVLGVQELFTCPAQGACTGFLSSLWPVLGALGSGLPGILTVNVFYNTPMVALFTVAGIGQSSPAIEEAVATLGGGPWRAFRDAWGKHALVGGATGALLTFLFSFLSFAPPLILGQYSNWTIEDWIYSLFQLRSTVVSPDLAVAVSLWTVLFLLGPSLLYVLLARHARLFGGTPRPVRTVRLGARSWRALPFLAASAALVGFVAVMIASVLVGSFVVSSGTTLTSARLGTGNWLLLFSPRTTQALGGTSTVGAILNTVFFAVVVTLLLLLVALAAGYARLRHPHVGSLVDLMSFVPMLVSPVILALALWLFYYGTLYVPAFLWVLIVGAQAGLALPFVLETISLALRSHSRYPREAAQTLGARRFRAFLDADVPMAKEALIAGALFAFALSLGEFTATNFLYTPAYTTLVVEMYVLGLNHFSATAPGAAAAIGALLVVISLAAFYIILGVGRRGHGRG